jgi:hypothetical protein
MRHDPFHQQILNGLSRPLDPDLFERCAADLLRSVWPTLVPIRGGNDAGMDGAIADGEGEPFPLVCTTEEDVIGNLTRSLDSYLASRGRRRKVMLVTSRKLTPKRRRGLEERAREKGFVLVQIYDRDSLADLLYHHPAWPRELVGLTGNPSALSVIPLTQRPLLGTELIGRDQDLSWLRQTNGDRVIVGVPGCGKTYLLHTYAKADEGLFVVSEDRGGIAAALRAQQPKRIIIDDAHMKLELLVALRHLRHDLGADFEIIASCWPGARDQVADKVQATQKSVQELRLLTRDEIVQVTKTTSIRGLN